MFRIEQVEMTMKLFDEFEQGMDHLQMWMNTVECSLQHAIRTRRFHPTELNIHQQSIEVSKRDGEGKETRREREWIHLDH